MVKQIKFLDLTPHEVMFEKFSLLDFPALWGNYRVEYSKTKYYDTKEKRYKIRGEADITRQDNEDMMLEDKILVMRTICNKCNVLKSKSLFDVV